MKLRWTLNARDDLRRIRGYIARDKRDDAQRWIRSLRERARGAASVARSGRVVPEFDRDDIREVIVGNYRIVYRIEARSVTVLTVFEGHRLINLSGPDTESTRS